MFPVQSNYNKDIITFPFNINELLKYIILVECN